MYRRLLEGLLVLSLVACAAGGGYQLVPGPNQLKLMDFDIGECMRASRDDSSMSAEERLLLGGRATSRFLMEGRPVVTPEGMPAEHQSMLRSSGSTTQSDKYVVCLLRKGYQWMAK